MLFRGLETGQVLGRANLVSGHVKTQLIAHDKEVYDIAFSKAGGGRDMFASVGADGKSESVALHWIIASSLPTEASRLQVLVRGLFNETLRISYQVVILVS